MKRKLSLLLVLTIFFSMSVISFADESKSVEEKLVYSEKFPNAYIKVDIEENNHMQSLVEKDNLVEIPTVTATVFVSETYELVNDEVVITSSRLLNKNEVDKIGENNFGMLDVPRKSDFRSEKSATESKGKLKIKFSGKYKRIGDGVECDLKANATWDGFHINPKYCCSTGEDFLGITWSGGFTVKDRDISGKYNSGKKIDIDLAKASPTKGRVYSFEELVSLTNGYNDTMDEIDYNITIAKNNLDGNGNTAEVVLQYTHTYQKRVGNITIGAGGAGFSLSSCKKQWPISCVVTNIPY